MIGRLPLPIYPTQLVAHIHQNGPQSLEHAVRGEPLEPVVYGGVGAELPRQSVPLGAGAEAVDDAVEHPPQAPPRPAGHVGSVELVQNVLERRL